MTASTPRHCQKNTNKHHTGQPPKMAEMLPYGSLHHDRCWPLHGQKSCYKNVIEPKWAPGPRAQYGRTLWQSKTVWSLVSVPTRQVMFLFHHIIIIIMDIDDDVMDVIVTLISGSMVGMVVCSSNLTELFSLARSLPRLLIFLESCVWRHPDDRDACSTWTLARYHNMVPK